MCQTNGEAAEVAAGTMAANAAQPRVLNINVGVLGHVDSGKTSLGMCVRRSLGMVAYPAVCVP